MLILTICGGMAGGSSKGESMSGYFEIGIYNVKTEMNMGTLWRSAYQLGASGIFTIGKRYQREASDTTKAFRHIPMRHYADFQQFKQFIPTNAVLIGIEMGGSPLSSFAHPKSCIYLLGAEDYGLPPEILAECNAILSLEAINQPSYNVAVAGSIVMYSRMFLRSEHDTHL
jgi:tRNA G18 (ribose-2'-O)-methylase SpoU